MAKIALQNPEMFPLRCCSQEVPPYQVASRMNAQLGRIYISRVAEHALPPAERWYCPNTTCGRWIAPKHIKEGSKLQKCPCCRTRICSSCQDLAHGNRDCANDPDLAQVLEVARRHRWQRCYNCRILVMKKEGCNHIICRCGAEFWYVDCNPSAIHLININIVSYVCGRPFPGCGCRDSARLADGDRIGEGGLDVATIVTAMEIAEREEAEIINNAMTAEPMTPAPVQQASASSSQFRTWSVRQPRVKAPARVGMPSRPMPNRHARPNSRLRPNETVVRCTGYERSTRLINVRPHGADGPSSLVVVSRPVTPNRSTMPVRFRPATSATSARRTIRAITPEGVEAATVDDASSAAWTS